MRRTPFRTGAFCVGGGRNDRRREDEGQSNQLERAEFDRRESGAPGVDQDIWRGRKRAHTRKIDRGKLNRPALTPRLADALQTRSRQKEAGGALSGSENYNLFIK
jgi:hypothetical protein